MAYPSQCLYAVAGFLRLCSDAKIRAALMLSCDRPDQPRGDVPDEPVAEVAGVNLHAMVGMSAPVVIPRLNDTLAPSWAARWGEDRFGQYAVFELRGLRQAMRWIRPGRFMMGSPETEPERNRPAIGRAPKARSQLQAAANTLTNVPEPAERTRLVLCHDPAANTGLSFARTWAIPSSGVVALQCQPLRADRPISMK
jgi:hypothetical protein